MLLIVSLIVFALARMAPGDPAAALADERLFAEDLDALRRELGVASPLWRQYADWIIRVMQGDLGHSFFSGMAVSQLMSQRLEPTISLAVLAMVLSVAIAVPLGSIAAYRAGSWWDRAINFASVLSVCAPVFILAYALIWIFSIFAGWLPVQGYVWLAGGSLTAWFQHLVLPGATLTLLSVALLVRVTRAAMLETLTHEYIRTAHAKGAGPVRVVAHALRNAAVPIAATVGTTFALLVGGVVVTETVFGIPGLGRLLVDAVSRRDYPVIQGVLLVSAFACVVINLCVDVSLRLLDPRIRL